MTLVIDSRGDLLGPHHAAHLTHTGRWKANPLRNLIAGITRPIAILPLLRCPAQPTAIVKASLGRFPRVRGNLFRVAAADACGPEDLIARNEQGYYLRDWITLHDADEGSVSADGPANVPAPLHRIPADAPANDPAGNALNSRQEWIVNELLSGAEVRRVHVEW